MPNRCCAVSTKPFFVKPTLEKDIEAVGCAYAFKKGWFEVKLTCPTRRGWPDRFYARKGRILLVEWKRPGEEPTIQQAKLHRELREHGVEVHWLNNLEAAYDLFR